MYHDSKGISFQLDEAPFAQGGEGKLFRIISPVEFAETHLVKIYHKHKLTPNRQAKLQYLLQHPPGEDQGLSIIWPETLIYNKEKEIAGFLMPLAKGEKLEKLTGNRLPRKMDKVWWRFDLKHQDAWDLRLRLCYNLATAVMHLHQSGEYVLVDLKPDNIIVQPEGLLYLVDLDSIEVVVDGEKLYDAPVATPEYTPPEHYRKLDQDPTSQQSWDHFGLAVIFYKLLLGIHPFAAANSGEYEQLMTLTDKIKAGLFVQAPSKKEFMKVVPPPHAAFQFLPSSVKELFVQCFESGHEVPENRPTAKDWAEVLLTTITVGRPLQKLNINTAYLQHKPAEFSELNNLLEYPNPKKYRKDIKVPEVLKKKIPQYPHVTERSTIEVKKFSKKAIPPFLLFLPIFFCMYYVIANIPPGNLLMFIIGILICICLYLIRSLYVSSKLGKRKTDLLNQHKAVKNTYKAYKKQTSRLLSLKKGKVPSPDFNYFDQKAGQILQKLEEQLSPLRKRVEQLNQDLTPELRKLERKQKHNFRIDLKLRSIPGNTIEEKATFLTRMGEKADPEFVEQLNNIMLKFKKEKQQLLQPFEEYYEYTIDLAKRLIVSTNKKLRRLQTELQTPLLQGLSLIQLEILKTNFQKLEATQQQLERLERELVSMKKINVWSYWIRWF